MVLCPYFLFLMVVVIVVIMMWCCSLVGFHIWGEVMLVLVICCWRSLVVLVVRILEILFLLTEFLIHDFSLYQFFQSFLFWARYIHGFNSLSGDTMSRGILRKYSSIIDLVVHLDQPVGLFPSINVEMTVINTLSLCSKWLRKVSVCWLNVVWTSCMPPILFLTLLLVNLPCFNFIILIPKMRQICQWWNTSRLCSKVWAIAQFFIPQVWRETNDVSSNNKTPYLLLDPVLIFFPASTLQPGLPLLLLYTSPTF